MCRFVRWCLRYGIGPPEWGAPPREMARHVVAFAGCLLIVCVVSLVVGAVAGVVSLLIGG